MNTLTITYHTAMLIGWILLLAGILLPRPFLTLEAITFFTFTLVTLIIHTPMEEQA